MFEQSESNNIYQYMYIKVRLNTNGLAFQEPISLAECPNCIYCCIISIH